MAGRIAVVGGANVDVGGFSEVPIVQGDSNPGKVSWSCGGVGRNIAECCARLGMETHLLTAIGGDPNGRMILEDCASKGIDTRECLILPDARTSVYLFIDNADGDMYCAVNDMEIQRELTPEFMRTKLDMLNRCDAVVIDANLSEETILFLARNVQVPVFADAVSTAKAARLKPALSHLYCLKPNRMEAELLTGAPVFDDESAKNALAILNDLGVKNIFLTMGKDGVVCTNGNKTRSMAGKAREVVNASGAGDAFMAALVWAFTEKLDLEQTCLAGMAASTIAIEAIDTVSTQMNRKNLLRRMREIARY